MTDIISPKLSSVLPEGRIYLWESFFFVSCADKQTPLPRRAVDLVEAFLSGCVTLPWRRTTIQTPLEFTIGEKIVSVHPRPLREDVTIAPSFDLRVDPTHSLTYANAYLLTGHCQSSGYDYALGWATWDEVQFVKIHTELRVPARCIPLVDLHPLQHLEEYLRCL